MFRRGFLASLAGMAGVFSLSRLAQVAHGAQRAKPESLPINPIRGTPERLYGSPAEELDGLGPQAAFVLGVDWKTFVDQLTINPKPFRELVHPANVNRCLKTAREESSRTARVAMPGEHPWAAEHERDWRVIEIGPCPFRS